MLCNRTVKRITYFLIIRQLRFDKYEDVAAELETLYLNCLGNHAADLLPSNELERLVLSNYISSKLLSSVLGSSADVESPLRRPKQSDFSSSEPYFVNQDAVSLPDKPLIDSISGTNSFSACAWNATKHRKRGRSAESSLSINFRPPVSPSDHISNELQEISAQLISEGQSPQPKTNSFSSLTKTDAMNIAADKSVDTLHSTCDVSSEHLASQFRDLPGSYTQYEIPDIADEPSINSVSSGSTRSLSPKHRPSLKNNPYLNDSNNKRVVAASVINEISATYHTTPDTVRLNTTSPTNPKLGANDPDQESSVLESKPTRECSTTELATVLEVPGKNSIPPTTTDVVGQTKHNFSNGVPIPSDPEKPGLHMSEAAKSSNAVAEKSTSTLSNSNQQQDSVVMETRIPITTIIDNRVKDREKVDENRTSSGESEIKPVQSSPQLSKLNGVYNKPRYTRFSDFGKAEDFANCGTKTSYENVPHQPATETNSAEEAGQLDQASSLSTRSYSTNTFSVSPDIVAETSYVEESALTASISATSSTSEISKLSDKTEKHNSVNPSAGSSVKNVDNVVFSLKIKNHIIEAQGKSSSHGINDDDKETIIRILNEGWKVETTFLRRVTSKVSCAVGCSLGDILFALFGNKISDFVDIDVNSRDHLCVKLKAGMDLEVVNINESLRTCTCTEKSDVLVSIEFTNRKFEARNKVSLHGLKFYEKIKIFRILAMGWQVEPAFLKKLYADFSCVTDCSIEDILYALFGKKISSYVHLEISTQGHFKLKLKNNNIKDIIRRIDAQSAHSCVSSSDIVFTLKLKDQVLSAHDIRPLLTHKNNLKILEILKEGWKNQKTFEKRVAEGLQCSDDFSLGDILYALFGDKISEYVDFSINSNGILRVKLKSAYQDQFNILNK